MTALHHTSRLHLRPFVPGDAPAIVAHLDDMETCRGLTLVPCPYTRADAEAFIATSFPDALAICLHDDTLIGAMGLGKQLGYWIGKPFWGKGYATEAARPVLGAHFAVSCDPVISGYVADNHASGAVLRKLGFRVTGNKMLHIKSRNVEIPAKSVALSKPEWEVLQ